MFPGSAPPEFPNHVSSAFQGAFHIPFPFYRMELMRLHRICPSDSACLGHGAQILPASEDVIPARTPQIRHIENVATYKTSRSSFP